MALEVKIGQAVVTSLLLLMSIGMLVDSFSPSSSSVIRSRQIAMQSCSSLFASPRENEIRRKILQLKRQGRIPNKNVEDDDDIDDDEDDNETNTATTLEKARRSPTTASADYQQKLKRKLGTKKLNMLGLKSDDDDEEDDSDDVQSSPEVQLGSLPPKKQGEGTASEVYQSPSGPSSVLTTPPIIDPSLFETDDDDDDGEDDMDEEELIELVAQKLKERKSPASAQLSTSTTMTALDTSATSTQQPKTITSGVGGAWSQTNETQKVETYQPKTGSWGAFPRPKDISKAYGGGRRVGAGITPDIVDSTEATRERLRQYREKVGIEVQSEKDHGSEIDQALKIAQYAMQRGMYSSAVSALEKVTKYCSTNSKVGGKVFLELAMAYEAEGRTKEAVTVYTKLTDCRIEEIKFDAKRLLYGIEAMNFMRNEAKSEAFSRKKIRNTFIETTGLANIAENFDDVWQTAYIDLDNGFYRRLTESVVRSYREARQILLQATGKAQGIEHMKIVQALRSLSRHFDTELEKEQALAAPQSVAVMDGKPILVAPTKKEPDVRTVIAGMDEFVLASADEMLDMINGEWRLQLLADRQGDGVKYDNETSQDIDIPTMTFSTVQKEAFVKVSQSGGLEFDADRRVMSRVNVQTSGGGVFGGLLGGKTRPAPQQIVSVDSVLLITRLAPSKSRRTATDGKGFFSVWRRVGAAVFAETDEIA